ncbi:iron(III) transport system ATP-binding protein/spermidine/putrescine transport system ATP-binding protein [Gemmobacter megaterium]|uniref:Iron(III) transport system ATP-binding protein/spermidine/putrescine transport system ATP-binding protein n=1 Tax=Gemmobacter megaterium TaxID=1086013 RepID=A0A1N7N311_9RHOB|nr:ABC transporter ATP-binding protein [Gemmobacter megaterium]GGE12743.1 spermidine/putrescine import ATP-binding protein PotA [Gemmobacter megaterium]SIS92720.1 iron(III) transport system ATP-binding protein/spermidine/putrescine transport system ATP-binding protein [Gemmobacter megaterium]
MIRPTPIRDAAVGTIDIENVSKSYGDSEVLSEVSLSIPAGSFLTLLGPSGCGKTTLLRLIAGFISPTRGAIRIDGRDMTQVPTQKRPIGMVFQNLALFPHFSVAENIAYGLKLRGISASEIETRVGSFIQLVGLDGLGERRIAQLSGGQKQRVALARSLVLEPAILLLDEPLSALDLQLRKQLQFALKDIQRHLRTTFVFVTHDQEEATMISDRIVVMSNGNVQQVGTPQEIYADPQNLFVAKFIGEVNELPGRVRSAGQHLAVETGAGTFQLPVGVARGLTPTAGNSVTICLRPEKIAILDTGVPPASGMVTAEARVLDTLVIGPLTRITLEAQGTRMISVQMTDALGPLRQGAMVRIGFPADAARVFAPLTADLASAFGEHA